MQPHGFSFHRPTIEKCQVHILITPQNILFESYPSILIGIIFWRFWSSTIPLLTTAEGRRKVCTGPATLQVEQNNHKRMEDQAGQIACSSKWKASGCVKYRHTCPQCSHSSRIAKRKMKPVDTRLSQVSSPCLQIYGYGMVKACQNVVTGFAMWKDPFHHFFIIQCVHKNPGDSLFVDFEELKIHRKA